jgi:hypothetical protein
MAGTKSVDAEVAEKKREVAEESWLVICHFFCIARSSYVVWSIDFTVRGQSSDPLAWVFLCALCVLCALR